MKLNSLEKKKFEEERARRILLHFFPEKYEDTVLSESPDIISRDKKIGVEVTDSQRSQIHRRLSMADSIMGKSHDELSEMDIRNIEEGRVVASPMENGQYLAGISIQGDTHDIETAYRKKHDKLNSDHFTKCDENNLFISAWFITDEELNEELEDLKNLTKLPDESHFDTVYIFTEPRLLEIHMESFEISTHMISARDLNNITQEAFYKIYGIARGD